MAVVRLIPNPRRNMNRPPWQWEQGTSLVENIDGSIPEQQNGVGTWYPLNGMQPLTVSVEGTFTGRVHVIVSCSRERPDEFLTDFPELGDAAGFDRAGYEAINEPFMWIKTWWSIQAGFLRGVFLMGGGPTSGTRTV